MKNKTLEEAKKEYLNGVKGQIEGFENESDFILNRVDFIEDYMNFFREYQDFSLNDFYIMIKEVDNRIQIF